MAGRQPHRPTEKIMAKLRDPDGGCPGSGADFATIASHTIEEAYEVVDAIETGDMDHLRDELGDLLLQVVFHAQMAKEAGLFDFDSIATAICDKMVKRHPHVFGDEIIETVDAQTTAWEDQQAGDRAVTGGDSDYVSVLADVTPALPAPTRAMKLQKRAARVGFDWPAAEDAAHKIHEELAEVKAELAMPDTDDHDRKLEEELRIFVRRCQSGPETPSTGKGASTRQREIRPPVQPIGTSCAPMAAIPSGPPWRKWTDFGTKPRPRNGIRRPPRA